MQGVCKHLEVENNLPHSLLILQVAAEEARPSTSVSTPQRVPVIVVELFVDCTAKQTSSTGHQYTLGVTVPFLLKQEEMGTTPHLQATYAVELGEKHYRDTKQVRVKIILIFLTNLEEI